MKKVSRQPAKRKQQTVTLKRVIKKAASLACLNTPQNVGYLPSMLVLTTLPHRRPKTLVHRRTNGDLTVEIRGDAEFGLPYGTYPRLILLYVCQQILIRKSAIVDVGDGLTDAMGNLGLAVTGGAKGTIRVLRRELDSLFFSSLTWIHRRPGVVEEKRCFFFKRRETWTGRFDFPSDREFPVDCQVEVDPMFQAEVLKHPVPTDLTVVRDLAALHGPFAIDLYLWLPYRLSRLEKPTEVSWGQLRGQFGAEYTKEDNFRTAFLEGLKTLTAYYPQARVEPCRGGLRLWPSASTIVPKSGG
jgi:hypothetical protein